MALEIIAIIAEYFAMNREFAANLRAVLGDHHGTFRDEPRCYSWTSSQKTLR